MIPLGLHGGLLSFELTEGLLEADTVHQWLTIQLPVGSSSFGGADLARDRAGELQAVEQDPATPATR